MSADSPVRFWNSGRLTSQRILANPNGGYSWMFSQGRDLAAWGGGKGDEVNPNAYQPRGKDKTL